LESLTELNKEKEVGVGLVRLDPFVTALDIGDPDACSKETKNTHTQVQRMGFSNSLRTRQEHSLDIEKVALARLHCITNLLPHERSTLSGEEREFAFLVKAKPTLGGILSEFRKLQHRHWGVLLNGKQEGRFHVCQILIGGLGCLDDIGERG
jgi:hypothetical protein